MPGEPERPAAAVPRLRVIALGASNLSLGLPSLVGSARALAGGAVEAFVACGFGRSYGVRSSVLGTALPGIDDCGLWDALANAPRRPAVALAMDVGNDVLYGLEPPAILAFVDRALERLRPFADRLVLAQLPVESISRMGPTRFRLFRTLLFPSCRLGLAEAVRRAERVHHGLAALARQHGAATFALPGDWYGFDPVHVRRRCRPEAFRGLLAAGASAGTDANTDAHAALPTRRALGPIERLRLARAHPDLRWRFGRERRAPQPTIRFADGTTIAKY